MKILYLTSKPIFPLVDGGCQAMKSFLDCLLFCKYEIKHLAINTKKHPFKESEYPQEIKNKINPESAFADTGINPVKAFTYLINKRSYNIDRFISGEMKELISKTFRNSSFDIVILDSLYSTPYLDQIRKLHLGKIYVRTHNVESEIWLDLAANTRNPLKKWYLNKLAKDLKSYEFATLHKVDGILTLTQDDLSCFQKNLRNKTLVNIPVHMELQNDFEYSSESNKVFHLGSYDWQPNIEAVEKLIEIWPEIKNNNPEVTLSIAGKLGEKIFRPDKSKGIEIHGFITDLKLFLSDKSVLVSPILSGSGVRIKILEMMAYGFPVVTTKLGAQGIDNCPGVLIAQNEEELVTQTSELLRSEEKRKYCSKENKTYIEQKHDIRIISKKLEGFIGK